MTARRAGARQQRTRRDPPRRAVEGVLTIGRRGDAFVRPDDGGQDVFVSGARIGNAMDGDRVRVEIDTRSGGRVLRGRGPRGRGARGGESDRKPEGTIVEILERGRSTVVGTFHHQKRESFVVPLDRKLQREVMIPSDGTSGAEDGDVVVVRLTSFGTAKIRPTGSIEQVLGQLADPGVDVLAVAHGFGLPLDFPKEVLRAADAAADAGQRDPGLGRVDRTDLLTFTIDPADARDHDDALSIEPSKGGGAVVGVHIADVSHFVRPGGPVDLEARARGTSVYLVDRAIPMLPAVLSSDVCSLSAGDDRLALSVFIELDAEGRIRARRYERTRIRCRHGLAYEDAQDVLDGKRSIDRQLDDALRRLDDLARRIREARHERGSLDLDLPEAKVILNTEGEPVDIQRRERLDSHRLIEDFMILANEVVASDLEAGDLAGLYRVHEPPSPIKAEELHEALAPLGIDVPKRRKLKPKDVQKLLEAPRSPESHDLVSALVLRTLAKARYDIENLGHFGLASGAYTHFTSPIRRYPDLVVHRMIAAAFTGGERPRDLDVEALARIAETSSEREQAADEAERATVALKKVEFMERHLGDVFTGRVTGVTSFGVFITLDEYFVDGLLHVRSLEDDFYRFSPRDYALVGERRGRRYRLGDRLRVQVSRVDKEARHIDFTAVRG